MIVRVLLSLACSISSYFIVDSYYGFPSSLLGFILGLLVALFVMRIEQAIRKVPLRNIFGGVVGMIVGLLIAFLLSYGLSFVSNIMEKQQVVPWIKPASHISAILPSIMTLVSRMRISWSSFAAQQPNKLNSSIFFAPRTRPR